MSGLQRTTLLAVVVLLVAWLTTRCEHSIPPDRNWPIHHHQPRSTHMEERCEPCEAGNVTRTPTPKANGAPAPPIMTFNDLALRGSTVRLLHIADGDTVRITGDNLITVEDRVRLLGIDAPERGEDGWATSREQLASFVRGHELRLEGTKPGLLTRGRCNRILAWLWADAVLVNWAMVLTGMARSAKDWGQGRYTPHLDDAAAWARAKGLPFRDWQRGRPGPRR